MQNVHSPTPGSDPPRYGSACRPFQKLDYNPDDALTQYLTPSNVI